MTKQNDFMSKTLKNVIKARSSCGPVVGQLSPTQHAQVRILAAA